MGTVSAALKGFVFLAQILNWIFARLDKAEQAKALAALIKGDLDKQDDAAIASSHAMGQALVEHFKANPGDVVKPDQDMVS